MKIAYHLALHKNLGQALDLLDAVWTPEDTFLVHIDLKTDDRYVEGFARHVQQTGKTANVFQQDRKRIFWATPSIMHLHLSGILKLLRLERDWDYYINLSGQDFPLKKISQLKSFLSSNPNMNYIEVMGTDEWNLPDERIRNYYVVIGGKQRKIWGNRRIPQDIKFYGGSVYLMLTRKFCEFIEKYPLTKRLVKFLRLSKIPDEILFQTLIMASPFRDLVDKNNYRHVKWDSPNDGHPVIYTMEHFEELRNSPYFFAKKFDWHVDKEIVLRLKENIFGGR